MLWMIQEWISEDHDTRWKSAIPNLADQSSSQLLTQTLVFCFSTAWTNPETVGREGGNGDAPQWTASTQTEVLIAADPETNLCAVSTPSLYTHSHDAMDDSRVNIWRSWYKMKICYSKSGWPELKSAPDPDLGVLFFNSLDQSRNSWKGRRQWWRSSVNGFNTNTGFNSSAFWNKFVYS